MDNVSASTSTYFLVAVKDPVNSTSTDIAAWNTVTFPTGIAGYIASEYSTMEASVGLFGADLSDFFLHCAVASNYCSYDDYHTFADGWAIGSYWETERTIASSAFINMWAGICLDD